MACRNCGGDGPASDDIQIYRGDTYVYIVPMEDDLGNPIDIDGCSYAAVVRTTKGSGVSESFNVAVDDISSTVTLTLTSSQTAALPNRGVWDLQETCGETVTTLIAGDVCVTQDVT